MKLADIGELTVNEIKETPKLTLLCSGVELSQKVDVYGVIVAPVEIL